VSQNLFFKYEGRFLYYLRPGKSVEDYLEVLRKAELPNTLGRNESCLWIRRSLLVLIRERLLVKLPGNPSGLRSSASVCG